jgi:hypothetical protein
MENSMLANSQGAPARVVGRPFKKGTSGNPGGRPRGPRSRMQDLLVEAWIESFTRHGQAAMDKLAVEKPDAFMRLGARLMPRGAERAADLPATDEEGGPDENVHRTAGTASGTEGGPDENVHGTAGPGPEPSPTVPPRAGTGAGPEAGSASGPEAGPEMATAAQPLPEAGVQAGPGSGSPAGQGAGPATQTAAATERQLTWPEAWKITRETGRDPPGKKLVLTPTGEIEVVPVLS